MKQIYYLLIISTFFVYTCGSSHQTEILSSHHLEYLQKIKKKLGSDCKIEFNTDSAYVLCWKKFKQTAQMPQRRVNFFIYEVNKDSLLYKSEIVNGSVGWINKHQVKIIRFLGNIIGTNPENKENITLYDVKDKKLKPFVEKNEK